MSAHSQGPWRLELVEKFPFGIKIIAADGYEVVSQAAAAFSSRQQCRLDNVSGVGFDFAPKGTALGRDAACEAIARQDANARVMAVAAEMLQALRGKNLACWCALDEPCHADVLLEIANAPQEAA